MSNATNDLTIETVGHRLYVSGNSYAVKDRLKSIGCKWDADRKQWWIGTSKRPELEAVLAKLDGVHSPAEEQSLDDSHVYGKVTYTSRSGKTGTYYVIGSTRDGQRHRLTTLNGSVDFWSDATACRWIKRYQPREVGYGRHAREQYQTLGGLRQFIERSKEEERDGTAEKKQCWECGCEFTAADARRNGGDWSDSYCGC